MEKVKARGTDIETELELRVKGSFRYSTALESSDGNCKSALSEAQSSLCVHGGVHTERASGRLKACGWS